MSGNPVERPRSGEPVEVYNAFSGDWSTGFVVAEATGTGYRLRRISDGAVLPAVFDPTDVRRTTT